MLLSLVPGYSVINTVLQSQSRDIVDDHLVSHAFKNVSTKAALSIMLS